MNNLLDEALAIIVARVGFAGKNELHRALFVADEFHNVVELLKNQRRAFVGGKAPGETDGECVRVQQMIEADIITGRDPLALEHDAPPGKFDEFAAEFVAQRPKFFVGDKRRIGHFFPEGSVIDGRGPVFAEFFTENGTAFPNRDGLIILKRNENRWHALLDQHSGAQNWLQTRSVHDVSLTRVTLEDLFVALAKDEEAK